MYNTASIQIQISNHVDTSQFILNSDDMKEACPYPFTFPYTVLSFVYLFLVQR
jgi:hypothetical protein